MKVKETGPIGRTLSRADESQRPGRPPIMNREAQC